MNVRRSFTLIFSAFLIGFWLLPHPVVGSQARPLSDTEKAISVQALEKLNAYLISPDSKTPNLLDHEAIVTYIQQRHPRVSSSDAHEIAAALVEQGVSSQIDPKFLAAIVSAESGFNKQAVSPSGAKGLGQLMNSTYRRFKVNNPFDAKQNIMATAKYVSQLLSMWEGQSIQLTLSLAAYLRGESLIQRSKGLLAPFTIRYTEHILNKYTAICNLRNQLDLQSSYTP